MRTGSLVPLLAVRMEHLFMITHLFAHLALHDGNISLASISKHVTRSECELKIWRFQCLRDVVRAKKSCP